MFICLKAEYPQRNNIKKLVRKVKAPKIIKSIINLFTGSSISDIFELYSASGASIILVNSLIVFPAIIFHKAFEHPEKKVQTVPDIIKNISSLPLKWHMILNIETFLASYTNNFFSSSTSFESLIKSFNSTSSVFNSIKGIAFIFSESSYSLSFSLLAIYYFKIN